MSSGELTTKKIAVLFGSVCLAAASYLIPLPESASGAAPPPPSVPVQPAAPPVVPNP